ncbi:hypothetical protein BDFB_000495 [Asbolus verrucosus]|uniref:C2H2-type domain-containing protein n=1 Tax=Asbolus verrucosus TaxID=1661398 RepID=A0A482VJJ3_ASBVE|nr:hypothetical protein BDFB_000495 [Asbolus verrucosus]
MCEICGKCFKSKNFLRSHRKTHTEQKTYICEMCGKGFPLRQRLKEHTRVHTKERPYVCKIQYHSSKAYNVSKKLLDTQSV